MVFSFRRIWEGVAPPPPTVYQPDLDIVGHKNPQGTNNNNNNNNSFISAFPFLCIVLSIHN